MTMGTSLPFRPVGTASVAASGSVATTALPRGGSTVLVFNAAASVVFIRFGTDSSVAAGTGDVPVPAGRRMLMDAGPFVTHASAVLASGSGSVYFIRGDGTAY